MYMISADDNQPTLTSVNPSTESWSNVGEHQASHSAECFQLKRSSLRPIATTIRRRLVPGRLIPYILQPDETEQELRGKTNDLKPEGHWS